MSFFCFSSSRSCWSGGCSEGQGLWLQCDLLRPVPAGRDRESSRLTEGQHAAGPAVPQRLRHAPLQPQRAQPSSDQRLHHQAGIDRHGYTNPNPNHQAGIGRDAYTLTLTLTIKQVLDVMLTLWNNKMPANRIQM